MGARCPSSQYRRGQRGDTISAWSVRPAASALRFPRFQAALDVRSYLF
jgi:hypothetical protein